MNKFCVLALFFISCISVGFAQEDVIKISIFNSYNVKEAIIHPQKGEYVITASSKTVFTARNGRAVYVKWGSAGVIVSSESGRIGTYTSIEIKPSFESATIRVLPLQPKRSERIYKGGFSISTTTKSLRVLNVLPLDTYIEGVVESEAGGQELEEYYKVQAIICRTFALSNLTKHKKQGFNLCDEVHCQAYKGMAKHTVAIPIAVKATENQVLVDSSLHLLQTVFHSNCGGETINSDDYWNGNPVSYLKSVKDTFCFGHNHATWTRAISKQEWLGYLQSNFNYNSTDPFYAEKAINYFPTERSKWFLRKDLQIPVRKIRENWKFRSTHFTIQPEGDKLRFSGRGFGHGVGLCQEGAMNRANVKHSYSEILHYYYKGVFIVDKDFLPFYENF